MTKQYIDVMFRSNRSVDGDNDQMKLIQDRIELADLHLGNICSTLAAYTRKVATVRDKGDETAKIIREYANAETLNRSLPLGLVRFSECLTAVEDHRQASIDRFDVKVVGQLGPYETNCKEARENVKKAVKARARQNDRKQQLQRARDRTPINRQEVAETELTKATADASQTHKKLETFMDTFEQKKLRDIKQTLLHYANIELQFHAKALELYTKAYNHIKEIDEEEDLQEFRNRLKTSSASSWTPGTSRLDLIRNLSAQNSLQSSPQRKPSVAFGPRESSSMQSLVGKLEAIRDEKDAESSSMFTSEEEEEEEEDDGSGGDSNEPEIEFLESNTRRIQVGRRT